MNNSTIETLLNHRSIRAYKKKAVDADTIKTLLEVANRTSTSMGMQSYSIIRITDRDKREKIAKICNQMYVNDAPEFWIYIVDLYRNAKIAAEQGCYLESRSDMDRFFQGFTDACLAAQSVMTAVESLGMGGVFFGSILNNSTEIIKVLNLPEFTFPVVGFGFGYPDQEPQLKPRMKTELKVFENEYRSFDSYLEEIRDYDKEMQTYYDLRQADKALDSFSKQVIDKLNLVMDERVGILNNIRKQGFEFGLKYIPEDEIRTMFKISPKNFEEHEFKESKSGIKFDTLVVDVFSKYPFVKEYLFTINPKFNKIKTIIGTEELEKMTFSGLADMGEMPADSLIYMIESRIDEE